MTQKAIIETTPFKGYFRFEPSVADPAGSIAGSRTTYHLIPKDSIFYGLLKLDTDWAGFNTTPPSRAVVERAFILYNLLAKESEVQKPHVSAGPTGFVSLSWSRDLPRKELVFDIYDCPELHVEWLIRISETDSESGESTNDERLVSIAVDFARR